MFDLDGKQGGPIRPTVGRKGGQVCHAVSNSAVTLLLLVLASCMAPVAPARDGTREGVLNPTLAPTFSQVSPVRTPTFGQVELVPTPTFAVTIAASIPSPTAQRDRPAPLEPAATLAVSASVTVTLPIVAPPRTCIAIVTL